MLVPFFHSAYLISTTQFPMFELSLVIWATLSPLSLHSRHTGQSAVFHTRASVSLFRSRSPFLNHAHVFPKSATSAISLYYWPYIFFSLQISSCFDISAFLCDFFPTLSSTSMTLCFLTSLHSGSFDFFRYQPKLFNSLPIYPSYHSTLILF